MSVINTLLSALTVASVSQPDGGGGGRGGHCAKYPNGTDATYHWFNCRPGTALRVLSVNVTDDAGRPNYPVDVSRKIIVGMVSQNDGGSCAKVLVDVRLSYWGGMAGCHWHIMPTLGLLKNIDACAISGDCPLGLGRIDFVRPVDLTPFAALISQLGGGTVYQMEMRTKCADSGADVLINCSTIQGLLK